MSGPELLVRKCECHREGGKEAKARKASDVVGLAASEDGDLVALEGVETYRGGRCAGRQVLLYHRWGGVEKVP